MMKIYRKTFKFWLYGCMNVTRPRLIPWLPSLVSKYRTIYSKTGVWDEEVTAEMKFAIEQFWGPRLQKHNENETTKEKFYVLSMFPYPSGALHMGHVRVYSISDAIARFYRMRGKNVIHPMGWDAFGLPAENAAIERGEQPDIWTRKNIANMKEQLQRLGCSFDWSREFSTCDPLYYKWTQYLFLLMFENGLAYQKEALVNWDPVDETVLADEQVDENGCSWRSGAKVEKKLLKQWFLRTTTFSKVVPYEGFEYRTVMLISIEIFRHFESLSDGLDDPVLENWRDVVKIQQHWIGKCDGVTFQFKLQDQQGPLDGFITVWTNMPEAIFGVAFIALSSNHILSLRTKCQAESEKSRLLDIVAIHPFTDQKIPLFVTDDITYPFEADAYLGIPGEIEQDKAFAERHDLQIIKVFEVSDNGKKNNLINSGQFSGQEIEKAKEAIISAAKAMGSGGYATSSKLHDWLISRQRYWGTPIPVIHCPNCKVVPVPYEDLPLVLPKIESLSGKGKSTLSQLNEWRNVKCPKCGSASQRETDTMDTFVDSSWYYLRFLDPHNQREPFSKDVVNANMPVDVYIGGKEHAAMHLYYARFVNHFCHSQGLTRHKEPFKKLLVQGMVLGQTHHSKDSGKYLRPEEVEKRGDEFVEKATGTPVTTDWEKMSKSRYNGVDPKDVLDEYGTDTTRLFMLGNFTPMANRNWSSSTFPGHLTWQRRLWLTIHEFRKIRSAEVPPKPLPADEFAKHEFLMFDSRNYFVGGVTDDFNRTFQLSIAISKLQGLTNSLRRMPPAIVRYGLQYEKALAVQIIMSAPIMPHFASELWAGFVGAEGRLNSDIDWDSDVLGQPWPDVDMTYHLKLKVKINDEETHVFKMARTILDNLTESAAMDILNGEPAVTKILENHTPTEVNFILAPGYKAEILLTVPSLKIKKKKKKIVQSVKTQH